MNNFLEVDFLFRKISIGNLIVLKINNRELII